MSEFKKGTRVELNEDGKEIFKRTPKPHTGIITGLPRDNSQPYVYITLDGRQNQISCGKDFLTLIDK